MGFVRYITAGMVFTLSFVYSYGLVTRCFEPPPKPEGCLDLVELYNRGCLTGYECRKYNTTVRDVRDVCANAPTCPPAPSADCKTSYQNKYIDGVRCDWGCKHWCCQDANDLVCPTASPTDPYCIKTHIVKYFINGKHCPVYCGCIPDCTVLTC